MLKKLYICTHSKLPDVMRIILNPKYECLRDYLAHIDEHFEKEGREIYRDRNVLRTLRVNGMTLCVKRYAPLSLRASIAVRLYKASKGKRAYFRPLQLRERGFESPEPIAFVKYQKGIFRTTTYFVCLHSDYRYSLSDVMALTVDERTAVTQSFARYAARLHEDGFLHRDFSASNILFDKINGRYHFALIDTNSIRIGRPVSIDKGCANFSRLVGDEDFFARLASDYAEARGADPGVCLQHINRARQLVG